MVAAGISEPFATLADPPVTFGSDELEAEFRDVGFVILPVLTPSEVSDVLSFYWSEIAEPTDDRLAIDFDREDRTKMEKVRAEVRPLVDSRLDRWFVDHRAIFATFVAKYPGPGSNMSLHEDRSWVDERRHRTGTMWIPLVDVGPGVPNGGIEVVPRSHRLARTWSGSLTPNLLRPYERWLRDRLVRLEIPSGSALYCDSRTLHASEPNTSTSPRVALALTVAPREAPLVHVVATGTSRRSIHAVDEDFYIRHGPWVAKQSMPSDYPVVEEVDECGLLEPGAMAAVIGEPPPSPSVVIPDDVAEVPATGWRSLEPVAGGTLTADVKRIAVKPGDRRDVAFGSTPGCLDVVESPPIGAGIVAGDRATNVLPGERYALEGTVSMWNDGPGTLVVGVAAGE